jgi:enoyl-CoA hydratase/carnithine racemase
VPLRELTDLSDRTPGWILRLQAEMDGAEASRFGVVGEVIAREELGPPSMGIARENAPNALLAVRSSQRSIDSFANRGLFESCKFEPLGDSVEFVSDDMPARYTAMQKRHQPEFEWK